MPALLLERCAGLPHRLNWYINRLRCMSPAEIGHRLERRLLAQAEQFGWLGQPAVPMADLTPRPQAWISVPRDIDPAPYLVAAERIATGKFDIFALHDVDLGSPPRWNRDPKSGIEAPLSNGKLLNYRDPSLVGDIKYLWELNRHLHLVRLAQAWALGGDTRYFQTIAGHLENWFASCPCGRGPNWSSALEAGLRLISWSVTWQLLGGAHAPIFLQPGGVSLRRNWLDSIHQHASFIDGYFSLHSSANNHLIGEAAGLFVAALTWPHWPQAAGWRTTAQAVLEREALLQNAPDGVNREQATAYQQFEFDLLLLPLLAGRANGVEFSTDYRANLERMLEYLAAIMDAGGHVPMFGDADDAVVAGLDPADSQETRYRSALATGAVLFGRREFKAKAGRLDDKTRWLLGTSAEAAYAALPDEVAGLPMRREFCKGGYYILGCDFESAAEIRLVADAGPLGYQRIAAHGHADALAFTLSVGGQEFLIDPGSYAYHTLGVWRAYFRGTAAHNTLRVDGQDQSQQGGNFMWLKKAASRCNHWESTAREDIFEGWHDGYERLADPVFHQRRIVLDKAARRILIEDRLQMQGEHEIELFFHCSEQCQVEADADGYLLRQGDQQLRLQLPRANHSPQPLSCGNSTPILGWVSRHFDEKTATTTLHWSARLRGDTRLYSQIQC